MKDENIIPITIKCNICKEPFETLFVVKDGQPYDHCCSMKCYDIWGSDENIRDRKINAILN